MREGGAEGGFSGELLNLREGRMLKRNTWFVRVQKLGWIVGYKHSLALDGWFGQCFLVVWNFSLYLGGGKGGKGG